MTYYINQTEARAIARNDLTIFREVNALMEQVIVDAAAGSYQTVVDDGTLMTNSTPDITITGNVANPTIVGGETFIINGTTITLGTTGTNLNSIIADINDAGVTGVVASKDASGHLVITYTTSQTLSWQALIGAGTANPALGYTDNSTHTATNPESVDFYSVWQGLTSDRAKLDQINQVTKYFENLGYTIDIRTNTSTDKTFKWTISY